MNVVIDGNTRLERVEDKNGTAKFAEVYFGWQTGNFFTFPSTTSAAEVAEGYKAQVNA